MIVTWFALITGTVCVVLGAVLVVLQWLREVPPVEPQQKRDTGTGFSPQGTVGETVRASADFAAQLAKLDPPTRLLAVGALFYAVAGVTAGIDSIAGAL